MGDQEGKHAGLLRLPDDALVIRGGLMHPSDLFNNAVATHLKLGAYGVSARAGIDVSVLDLLNAPPRPIPHPVLRRSTVGRLRVAGFEVELTMGGRHCTIWLRVAPTDDLLDQLIACFNPPEPRPRVEES